MSHFPILPESVLLDIYASTQDNIIAAFQASTLLPEVIYFQLHLFDLCNFHQSAPHMERHPVRQLCHSEFHTKPVFLKTLW
jgi:hypothetical protein